MLAVIAVSIFLFIVSGGVAALYGYDEIVARQVARNDRRKRLSARVEQALR